MKNCIVIFPLYQAPTALELAFLENGIQQTQGYKQVIAAPEGLNIDHSFGLLQQLEVKRFAKHFFESISGYNQLLLTKDFYNAFKLFDYMLIHQADVYLFRNDLQLWCEKNYDYIGAPWFRPQYLNRGVLFRLWLQVKLAFKQNKLYGNRYNKAGNGGLSLRKTSSALKVLTTVEPSLLKKYTNDPGSEFNEDIFWSLEAPNILADYAIPDLTEALQFAIEFEPAKAYQHIGQNLPFGCHAPLKHDVTFWKKFIPAIN